MRIDSYPSPYRCPYMARLDRHLHLLGRGMATDWSSWASAQPHCQLVLGHEQVCDTSWLVWTSLAMPPSCLRTPALPTTLMRVACTCVLRLARCCVLWLTSRLVACDPTMLTIMDSYFLAGGHITLRATPYLHEIKGLSIHGSTFRPAAGRAGEC